MTKNRIQDSRHHRGAAGQALVEYVLIAVLVIGALILALLATGPALGNVFSNAVIGAIGNDGVVRATADESISNGATAFWYTVTWVSQQTPEDAAVETNEPGAVATDLPPDWVPPTAAPPKPTDVPDPTETDVPSPTPPDEEYKLPFDDRADNVVQGIENTYRLTNDVFIGQDAWTSRFWRDTDREGNVIEPFSNPVGSSYSLPPLEANTQVFLDESVDLQRMDEQNFSAQFARNIYNFSDQPITLGFRITNPSGGVRMWYRDEGGCSTYEPDTNARNSQPSMSTSPCLIIDEWVNTPGTIPTAYIELPAGGGQANPAKYTIFMEFYQLSGRVNLDMDIVSPQVNPDDAASGDALINCTWGQNGEDKDERNNSRTFSWNSAIGLDEFPDNQTCYLELRGYVQMASNPEAGFTLSGTPLLSFWHIWDLNNETSIALEVAPYDTGAQERPTSWTKVWPTKDRSGTRNYEWTQEVVDLSPYIGQALTYRFVIESNGSAGGRKRWYIDDVQLENKQLPDLTVENPSAPDTFTICEDRSICDGYFPLNDEARALANFRTTGRWALTANRAVDGLAWEDDPDNPYTLEGGSGLRNADGQGFDQRVYWIEFNRRIDVSNVTDDGVLFKSTPTDSDGDVGPPMLSFYTSYSLQDNAKLEVQYFDDTNQEWRLLKTIARTGDAEAASQIDIQRFEVLLNEREAVDVEGNGTGVFEGVDEGWTEWYTKPLRIRFAMTVNEKAIAASSNIGWTIDEIMLERLGSFAYQPYPFEDSAGDLSGDTLDVWFRTGNWGVTDADDKIAYTDNKLANDSDKPNYSFTDSPNGDYTAATNSILQIRAPFDLNSDTPANSRAQQNCNPTLAGECVAVSEQQEPADKPVLSFWWKRSLANAHNFTVEICPDGGNCAEPITVWEYRYNAVDNVQMEWERVEIALYPFIVDEPASDIEDDIVVTFRLNATGDTSVTSDGVYIDVIEIKDEEERPTFKLWSGLGDRDGDGQVYIDSIEDRTFINTDVGGVDDSGGQWWNRWYLGGGWTGLNPATRFPARSGTQVMHESPHPLDDFDIEFVDAYDYTADSFHVMEMRRTIDLTGVELSDLGNDPTGLQLGGPESSPILYWWWRVDKGQQARIRVDISSKLDPPPATLTDPLTYGDDEVYGWSPWKTVYITPPSMYNGNQRVYQWRRQGVNLQNVTVYDSAGAVIGSENFVGKVIRVRFILDANDVTTDTQDGWFLDDIMFTAQPPRAASRCLAEENDDPCIYELPFVDEATSMANWVGEGQWGLDVYKTTSAPPQSLAGGDSAWSVEYLNCNYRPVLSPPAPASGDIGGCGAITYDQIIRDGGGDNWRASFVDSSNPNYATYNPDDQWYVTDNISSFEFDINYDTQHNGRPPGAPTGKLWEDYFVSEFQRTISIDDPLRYNFYVRTDDGVRVGITPYPTTSQIKNFPEVSGDVNTPPALNSFYDTSRGETIFYDNIINAWRYEGSPTVYQGSVTLVPNNDGSTRDYLLTVQAFEHTGTAEISFGVGGSRGSFSDSPMLVPSSNPDNDRIKLNYWSNTALTLNGLLDLRGANVPVIEYETQYYIRSNNYTMYLEISTDGGFTWTQDDLRDGSLDYPGGTISASSSTQIRNGRRTSWRTFRNALNDYVNQLVMIRWRVDVDSNESQIINDSIDDSDGIYVTDIRIFDLSPSSPQPQIVVNPSLRTFVDKGETTTLSVVATGFAPLKYEWFLGDPPLDPNVTPLDSIPVGTDSPSYTPPVTGDNNIDGVGTYQYWVRVSNAISDGDPGIPPAISIPAEIVVRNCTPVLPGDCNTYRINTGGADLASTDNSNPGWSGTNTGSNGEAFLPNESHGTNEDTNISIAGSANVYQNAANNGPAPERLYETWVQKYGDLSWTFPVEPGEYIVRLYLANPYNSNAQNARIDLDINGQRARYWDYTYDGSGNKNYSDYTNRSPWDLAPERRVGIIVEMEPIEVTAFDNELYLYMDRRNGRNTFISGIEIFPSTAAAPEIVRQPNGGVVTSGDDLDLELTATGANLTITWYQGTVGNTSNPVSGCVDTASPGALSLASTCTLTNVTVEQPYWAQVVGGDPATITVDSQEVTPRICTDVVGNLGACGIWTINFGGDNNTYTAPDGTVWHSERANGFDPSGIGTEDNDGLANQLTDPGSRYYPGNVDINHVAPEIFRSRRSANKDWTWSIGPLDPGVYDVTLFFADNDNNTSRKFHIFIEGNKVANNYNMRLDVGVNDTVHSERYTDITVEDDYLTIRIDYRSGWGAQVAGVEAILK